MKIVAASSVRHGFPQPKPAWVKDAVLELHRELNCSHRKLADTFNRLYFAETGVSVGRTWVREFLKNQAYELLQLQKTLKHRIPLPLARNVLWGIDTTCIRDVAGRQHIVLGIIDHGSRRNLMLQHMKRFNAWTFLGYLFLAFGKYGRPKSIKTDNHAVFRSLQVKKVLRKCRVRRRFSEPGKPWQNGRIERFFGTLKAELRFYMIADRKHLIQSLAQFQFWYDVTRSHQHLNGNTPIDAWEGIDSSVQPPKSIKKFEAWNGRLKGIVIRQ